MQKKPFYLLFLLNSDWSNFISFLLFVLIVKIYGNETCAPWKLVWEFSNQLAEISRELEQSLSTSIFSKSSGTAQSNSQGINPFSHKLGVLSFHLFFPGLLGHWAWGPTGIWTVSGTKIEKSLVKTSKTLKSVDPVINSSWNFVILRQWFRRFLYEQFYNNMKTK